jgi:hypothetical protein
MTDALDARARRAARREGLMARKSRWRVGTIDNLGGYRLINPRHNICVDGECKSRNAPRLPPGALR